MPVQIGFFGAGSAAQRHADVLSRLENAQIVAVCDIAPQRAESFAQSFGANIYSSPNRMMNGENLDALYICTPPNVRGPVEISAAKAGIALFIETPVALNLATAQSVLNAINRAGVPCGVGSYWRYFESTERLRKLISPKNAPKPLLFSGDWLENPPATAWREDPKLSGGVWLDGAYQMLDLARIFGGEVVKVGAMAAPESKSAIFQFANGARGTFNAGRFLQNGERREFSIATADAIHFLSEASMETRRGEETALFHGTDDAILAQNAAFLRAVETGKRTEIRATYADAMKTLRLGLGLNRAGLGSRVVSL